jgi:hypothetical protein
MSIKKSALEITASIITSLPYTKTSSNIVDKLLIESEKIKDKKKNAS